MPKVVVDTRTDINSVPSAKLGLFDIKAEDTVKGWKVSAVAQPKLGAIDSNGFGGFKGCNVDVIAKSKEFNIYLDNIDLLPEGKWAPRVSYNKDVDVQGKKYNMELLYAMRGNTSVLPERKPLHTDILKLAVKAPAVGGWSPKFQYGTLTNVVTTELKGKVDKLDVTLKTDYNMTKKSLANQLNLSYPLPEKMKLAAELKLPSKSGKMTLSLDRYAVEVPLKQLNKVPDPKSAVIKIKYSKNFDV